MSKVFISYSCKDLKHAQMFAKLLEGAGFDPWWDKKIPPGSKFDKEISKALDSARCILVLWSKNSVQSDWVIEEALEARDRNILVPVMLNEVEIPFGFKRFQAVKFMGWKGSAKSENAQLILNAISLKTGKMLQEAEEMDESLWEKFLNLLGIETKTRDKKLVEKEAKQVKVEKRKRKLTGGLDGKTIVFTGKLAEPRTIQAEKVEALGGRFVDSASGKTDLLIIGENPGNEKLAAAKKHNIHTLNEKQWMDLLNKTYRKLFAEKRVFFAGKMKESKGNLETMARKLGAVVSQKFNEKDNFLIVGEKPPKTALTLAKKHQIRVIKEHIWEEVVKTL
ncbi:MAG: TIR domain-containing protein [Bacteroidia bacterium]|nr:TIR domain-containing protein [Bacteroidia bacterium]